MSDGKNLRSIWRRLGLIDTNREKFPTDKSHARSLPLHEWMQCMINDTTFQVKCIHKKSRVKCTYCIKHNTRCYKKKNRMIVLYIAYSCIIFAVIIQMSTQYIIYQYLYIIRIIRETVKYLRKREILIFLSQFDLLHVE
jgi:hypothetical protein